MDISPASAGPVFLRTSLWAGIRLRFPEPYGKRQKQIYRGHAENCRRHQKEEIHAGKRKKTPVHRHQHGNRKDQKKRRVFPGDAVRFPTVRADAGAASASLFEVGVQKSCLTERADGSFHRALTGRAAAVPQAPDPAAVSAEPDGAALQKTEKRGKRQERKQEFRRA